ncbi:hypothetical protein BSSC8_22770 [Bacillus subtilis subsp. subtilis str. SC-8]|nr:hypothetical protein BSSC8_22770 [Bacillus subtilis subsp. subtilis str. SC-8]
MLQPAPTIAVTLRAAASENHLPDFFILHYLPFINRFRMHKEEAAGTQHAS